MRIFVGITPTVDLRAGLAHSISTLDIPGKITPVENWHFTLAFIGDVDEVSLDRLMGELDQADLGRPFSVSLEGLGAFPNAERATVAWVGLSDGADRMSELADVVAEAIEQVGLRTEDRPFVPHISLSRIRPPLDIRRLVESASVPRLKMEVSELTVYESHLGEGRPRYEVVDRIVLG